MTHRLVRLLAAAALALGLAFGLAAVIPASASAEGYRSWPTCRTESGVKDCVDIIQVRPGGNDRFYARSRIYDLKGGTNYQVWTSDLWLFRVNRLPPPYSSKWTVIDSRNDKDGRKKEYDFARTQGRFACQGVALDARAQFAWVAPGGTVKKRGLYVGKIAC